MIAISRKEMPGGKKNYFLLAFQAILFPQAQAVPRKDIRLTEGISYMMLSQSKKGAEIFLVNKNFLTEE